METCGSVEKCELNVGAKCAHVGVKPGNKGRIMGNRVLTGYTIVQRTRGGSVERWNDVNQRGESWVGSKSLRLTPP